MSASQELDSTLLDHTTAMMDTQQAVLEIRELGLPKGFFNVTALDIGGELGEIDRKPGGQTLIAGRYVETRGEPGQPDIGTLATAIIRDGKAGPLTEIWTPQKKGDTIEDLRAALHGDQLVIGSTRLALNEASAYRPYPAFSTTTVDTLLEGKFPETRYLIDQRESPDMIHLMEGKNATPLGVSDLIMYRKETDDHRFVVSHLNTENPELPYYITIPKAQIPDWGERRMGTTMAPIWLNANEALMLLHGIQMKAGKYIYSIGSARLFFGEDGKLSIDNISRGAHLTPDSFNELFQGEEVELRPEERRAVYICGGIAVYKSIDAPEFIKTYPNVGDTRTVEATFSVSAITANWRRPETSPPLVTA